MATFPQDENNTIALGRELSAGLKAHKDIYPNPPVDPKKLDEGEKQCLADIEAAAEAQALAEQAVARKNASVRAHADDIRSNLRYAENTVNFDDIKLKLIGWSGRRERTALKVPGRALDLRIMEEGEGRIVLHWGKPIDGGKPAAYNVVFRERTAEAGDWHAAGTAFTTEITLTGQIRGKPLEYGVVAANKAGEGPVSNTVTAVL
uniref:Fibronectin type-III domain-containing protein n=1 Tax=Candidatus Kentrum sp. DK TaxID=2126562 RepID=A0A450S093_9GAMM|nr:MAG: hypothetical protein BECKDK2373C_GA0170839_101040 [Candidatus Kentron sp. DK]